MCPLCVFHTQWVVESARHWLALVQRQRAGREAPGCEAVCPFLGAVPIGPPRFILQPQSSPDLHPSSPHLPNTICSLYTRCLHFSWFDQESDLELDTGQLIKPEEN